MITGSVIDASPSTSRLFFDRDRVGDHGLVPVPFSNSACSTPLRRLTARGVEMEIVATDKNLSQRRNWRFAWWRPCCRRPAAFKRVRDTFDARSPAGQRRSALCRGMRRSPARLGRARGCGAPEQISFLAQLSTHGRHHTPSVPAQLADASRGARALHDVHVGRSHRLRLRIWRSIDVQRSLPRCVRDEPAQPAQALEAKLRVCILALAPEAIGEEDDPGGQRVESATFKPSARLLYDFHVPKAAPATMRAAPTERDTEKAANPNPIRRSVASRGVPYARTDMSSESPCATPLSLSA